MLTIRMQRLGRKGLAQYRVVVQDSRQTPTSGKVVANLGHFNPHTKEHGVDIDKAKFYLEHGAQPSSRVAKLLSANGVKLPSWVEIDDKKSKKLKNAEKLRKNQPDEPAEEAAPEAEATETSEAPAEDSEAPSETKTEEPAEPEAEKAEESKADETDEAKAES